jgi:DNA (cytosine-5)-methyltransferase 1
VPVSVRTFGDGGVFLEGGSTAPLTTGTDRAAQLLMSPTMVRRLTPTECERLQGFPDGYTLVPYRGKAAADGPRYKALGNSMAVNVMRWIGRRIATAEAAWEGGA